MFRFLSLRPIEHEMSRRDSRVGSHAISLFCSSEANYISAGKGTVILSPTSAAISLYQVMKYEVRSPLTVL